MDVNSDMPFLLFPSFPLQLIYQIVFSLYLNATRKKIERSMIEILSQINYLLWLEAHVIHYALVIFKRCRGWSNVSYQY